MNPHGQLASAAVLPLPDSSEERAQVAGAFAAARAAQPGWASVPVARRLERVRALRHWLAQEAAQLAQASAQARSRPLRETLTAEVMPLAEACRFLEREAKAILRPRRYSRWQRPLWLAGVRSTIHREPFGVVLIIGPGNYPLLLPGVQLLQALVAGNAVVLKPGVGGTAAAQALLRLLRRAGFPEELVALLPEAPAAARAAILARPDKVVFTGSAAVGAVILGQLAPQLIPATLELSGCDAVVVQADADLELTAKALAFGLRLNNGATCLAPKRVFVERAVARELEELVTKALQNNAADDKERQRAATLPDPLAFSSAPGYAPASWSAAALCRCSHLNQSLLASAATKVAEALASGAHLAAGELREDGTLGLPLVLAEVSPRAALLQEDYFLPLLALVTVKDEREAVLRANACPFALGASVFSRDEAAARALAAELNAGVVTINDLIVPTADPRLPFGGRQHSGFGVTRGAEGLLELTQPKVVTASRGRYRPAFEPTPPGDEPLFQAYLALAHGRGVRRRWGALVALVRALFRKALLEEL